MLKSLIKVASLFVFVFAPVLNATYVYEANQSLFNLVNEQNTTNMAAGDDQVSAAFNLDFTFTFYGQDFTSARMATNGCLHFKTSGSYCNDYTPDPLPQITYTLYPFWTDLIRDSGSSVLAKNFTDKTVFGWYDLREYNRSGSDNSFEVILWKTDDSFEFRYGALDIINHDVLIGEQGTSSELYTYLFHDECNVGTTNIAGTCVNTDWNNTSFNTSLENGGSLYGLGSGNALDCSSPLNNAACVGYEAAYFTQQCTLDALYSTQCLGYWDARFDYECTQDPQSSPACAGYMVETYEYEDYYEEEFDYGYTDEDMWYDEEYDEWLDPNDPCYENGCEGFTDQDWYELDVEQFGQEQVDEWFGTEVEFASDGMVEWETTTMESYDDVDVLMEEYDLEQEELYYEEYMQADYIEEEAYNVEELHHEEYITSDYMEEDAYNLEELYNEPLLVDYELVALDDVYTEQFEHQQLVEVYEEEPRVFLDFRSEEELEEWYEEEMEETVEEAVDETVEEAVDETVEEAVDEATEKNEKVVEKKEKDVEKKDKMKEQLKVVAKTMETAAKSVSNTGSSSSISTVTSDDTGNVQVDTSSSSSSFSTSVSTAQSVTVQSSQGGVSMNSSPSISAQVSSSAAQTQQVLSLDVSTSGGQTNADNVGPGNVGPTNTSVATGESNVAVGNVEPTNTSVTTSANNVAVGSTSSSGQSSDTTTTTTSQGASVQTQSVEAQIAMVDVSATTDTDSLVAQIVAENVKVQQEEMEEQQAETGEYADATTLIGYMGYVPGFNAYTQVRLSDQANWYQPKAIYGNVSISDNNAAFYGMYGDSLRGMTALVSMQPKL